MNLQSRRTIILLSVVILVFSANANGATLTGKVSVSQKLGKQLRKLEHHGNAVVFLVGIRPKPPEQKEIALKQQNKTFIPRVLAITKGEVVQFPNTDKIHHNVWSRSKTKRFDLGLYKHPETHSVKFGRPGIVTVFCNIHPQMIATILVLPNKKYAVTDDSGAYRIDDIPDGEFLVYGWVEGARPVKTKIKFEKGKTVNLNLNLTLRRIPIRHLNKEGKPYKKY